MFNYKVFIRTYESDIEVAEFNTIKECREYIQSQVDIDDTLVSIQDFYIYGKID